MSDEQTSSFGRRLSGGFGMPPSDPLPGADSPESANQSAEHEVAWFAETFSRLVSNVGRVLRGKDDQ